MFFQPIFPSNGPDIRGHIMRCRDEAHAREVAPDAIRIDEIPAEGVRGYYDHIDGFGTYWTSDAARNAAAPTAQPITYANQDIDREQARLLAETRAAKGW